MSVVDIALTHAQARDLSAYALAFVAGLATSIGPCVAPRYVAVAALMGSANGSKLRRISAFVAGTITVYLGIASAGSAAMRLAQASSAIYFILAVVLIVSGAVTLWRGSTHACVSGDRRASTLGAAFFLGAATSTTISPCCTPILVGLGALSATSAGTASIVALVSAYTVGHIAPLLGLSLMAAGTERKITPAYRVAAATVSAAVTIALGVYYAVLA